MYVGAQFGEVTIWGYVDAVFVNPDGTLTLVDFKTDTLITSPGRAGRRAINRRCRHMSPRCSKPPGCRSARPGCRSPSPTVRRLSRFAVDVLSADELLGSLRAPVGLQTSRQLT